MKKIVLPSIQSLLIEMRFSGQPISTGTAFIAQTKCGPVLVTNRHNVTGRHQETGKPLSSTCAIPNEIVIYHNHKDAIGTWITKIESLLHNDVPRWIEHPELGPRADFVALPLTQLNDIDIYPYDPANPGQDISFGPADPVSVIGFPFGITAGGALGVWVTGFIASEPTIDFSDLPIQLIDCRSRPGQSGSPVIAYRSGGTMVGMNNGEASAFAGPVWRFIGIYSGRINNESDLGIVWKASAIQELLQSIY